MVSSATHIPPKEWKPYSSAAGSGPGRNSLGIRSQPTNLQFSLFSWANDEGKEDEC